MKFSEDGVKVLDAMGRGMRLRIPHDGTGPVVVEGGYGIDEDGPFPVSPAVAAELIEAGVLHKISEYGEEQRAGWRSKGYDGNVADWYCMRQ